MANLATIKEIKIVNTVDEANFYLSKGWVLLLVYGAVEYCLGEPHSCPITNNNRVAGTPQSVGVCSK